MLGYLILINFMDSSNILKILQDNNLDTSVESNNYFSFHKDRFNFLIKKLQENYHDGKSFLELGSFRGYMMIAASLIGYKVSGVDLEKYVDEIRELSEKYNFTNLPLDLEKNILPFQDNSFDVIVFSEVLEHLNFHPGRVFSEIARVLKKNGHVIVTTPNLSRLNNIVKLIFNNSINAELDQPFHEGTHYREYTSQEIVYLMKEAGLHNIETTFLNFKYPDLGFKVVISDFISNIFPKKKRDLCIIGEKI